MRASHFCLRGLPYICILCVSTVCVPNDLRWPSVQIVAFDDLSARPCAYALGAIFSSSFATANSSRGACGSPGPGLELALMPPPSCQCNFSSNTPSLRVATDRTRHREVNHQLKMDIPTTSMYLASRVSGARMIFNLSS